MTMFSRWERSRRLSPAEYIPEVVNELSSAEEDPKVVGAIGFPCGGGFKDTADEDASEGGSALRSSCIASRPSQASCISVALVLHWRRE